MNVDPNSDNGGSGGTNGGGPNGPNNGVPIYHNNRKDESDQTGPGKKAADHLNYLLELEKYKVSLEKELAKTFMEQKRRSDTQDTLNRLIHELGSGNNPYILQQHRDQQRVDRENARHEAFVNS